VQPQNAQPQAVPLILIADDVPANVELLFDQLQTLGYRTIAATDGPSALKMCVEERPDLCILDVAMPDMEDLAERFRPPAVLLEPLRQSHGVGS
jgi:CheY-like chemotaxis protein